MCFISGTRTASAIPLATMPDSQQTAIDSWTAYRAAVLSTICRAQSSLILLDPDLRETGLESSAGIEALSGLLQRSSHAPAIRFVLEDAGYLERECPRLLSLLARFGHKIHVRLIGESQPRPDAPFIIADASHLTCRFQRERPRGKQCIDCAAEISAQNAQFETLWISALPGPSGVALGL